MRLSAAKTTIVIGATLIFGSSCSVALTTQGGRIAVVPDSQAKECDSISPITATHSSGWTMGGDLESVTNEARNKAAELGADSILIQSSNSDFWGGASVAGIALKCKKN